MTKKGYRDKHLAPRNAAIYKAYVCGEEGESLAKQYSITKSRVSQIVIEMEGRFLENEDAFIFAEKRRHQILLEGVYDKAARGYAKSLEDAESTKVSSGPDANGGKAEKTTKGQAGDPAFLRVMCQALADIRKIWGMDAPVKTANTHELTGGMVRITERVVSKRQAVVDAFNENGSNGNRNGNGRSRS